MDKLKELFYDPKKGFASFTKFKQRVKEAGIKISDEELKKWLEKQFVTQVTAPVEKAKEFNSIISHQPNNNWQLDLLIYNRYEWKGYQYILVIIDVHSRYVWAFPLTNRRNETIMNLIDEVGKNNGYPKNINLDQEFDTTEFEAWCKKHNVKAWFSETNEINKNAIVERFNRTIAAMIQRVRVATKRYDWPKFLPDLIENYNSTIHRTTKQKPIDVFNGNKASHQIFKILEKKFNVGDKVRIKITQHVFSKGDSITYSPEVYIVSAIKGNRYELKNAETHEAEKRAYKPYEIKRINEIEYKEPVDEAQEEEHNAKVKEKKIGKKNKQSGLDVVDNKIVVPIRASRPKREAKPTNKFLESVQQQNKKK